MNHPSTYRNQRVVVLGLARSGVSVAKVFHNAGALVVVNDRNDRQQCPEAEELETLGIEVICGSHPEGLVTSDTELLVKNPGIPYHVPPVQDALAQGIEVVTEVEVAGKLTTAPMIGITGSNGKTTTTTWVGELLADAGIHAIVAGNIGRPLCEAAQEVQEGDWIVAELSSFQLKGTTDFAPRIAALLNVVETHLDYHGGMTDYIASKAKLFANQRPQDTAVFNWDDAICRRLAEQCAGRKLPFSLAERLQEGVFIEPPYPAAYAGADLSGGDQQGEPQRHMMYRDSQGTLHTIVAVDELGIPGKHNAANAMAAAAICLAAGVAPALLARPLRDFRAVEHRLEFTCTKQGVHYYNDSKATNPTATIMSVQSLKGDIVLIAGGLDRGSDYMELLPLLKNRIKAIVLLGETRHKLQHVAELAGLADVEVVEPVDSAEATLSAAVQAAAAFAREGDTVLLSPACASWDMFKSYEQRGDMFKHSAHTL
ncbi:UDP-N-acetylmuramoyl-L-alanine--D-glutamate ligase [Paenibacillaceae bacterium]|nr:UDP-N-acetylmuramoyl-L-alanine--D-glutamate ligase [Paenibacillaceae bacterium]